jgi:hypothetical protein
VIPNAITAKQHVVNAAGRTRASGLRSGDVIHTIKDTAAGTNANHFQGHTEVI